MGGLIKAIFGGDDGKDEYNKTLAEQEHRKEMAEEKERQKSIEQAKANALAEADREKRKKAFLASSSTVKEEDDKLGGSKSLLG